MGYRNFEYVQSLNYHTWNQITRDAWEWCKEDPGRLAFFREKAAVAAQEGTREAVERLGRIVAKRLSDEIPMGKEEFFSQALDDALDTVDYEEIARAMVYSLYKDRRKYREDLAVEDKEMLNSLKEAIKNSWANTATWECDGWILNEGPTEELYREAREARIQAGGNDAKAARILSGKIREAVEAANPLSGRDDLYANVLRDALGTIDYVQISRCLIGDLDNLAAD